MLLFEYTISDWLHFILCVFSEALQVYSDVHYIVQLNFCNFQLLFRLPILRLHKYPNDQISTESLKGIFRNCWNIIFVSCMSNERVKGSTDCDHISLIVWPRAGCGSCGFLLE